MLPAVGDYSPAAGGAGSFGRGGAGLGPTEAQNGSLDAVDVAVVLVGIQVALGQVDEVSIYEIGADGQVGFDLPLHSEREMLRGVGDEIGRDELSTLLCKPDGGERKGRLVWRRKLRHDLLKHGRQNRHHRGTWERSRGVEIQGRAQLDSGYAGYVIRYQ